jgi:hypothetical protein
LNWIAGDEGSFSTGPRPHTGQTATGASENFCMTSNTCWHASHRYSYNGMAVPES